MIDFDLQLFAEDGDVAIDTEPIEQSAPEPSAEDNAPDIALKVDEETGRRTLVVPETPEVVPEDSLATASPYGANDLIKDFAMGRVDETRIPDELAGYYSAIKQQRENEQARQQIAIQQAQLNAMNEQRMREIAPASTEAVAATNPNIEIYNQMQDYATKKAYEAVGVKDGDELEELRYSDNPDDNARYNAFAIAKAYSLQQLTNAVAVNQQKSAVQREFTNKEASAISDMYTQARNSEPNFDAIDNLMGEYWKQMPYEKGAKVKAAIDRAYAFYGKQAGAAFNPGNKNTLADYYNECRRVYYQAKVGVGSTPRPAAKPPTVEHTGQIAQSTPTEQVDWKSMRNMSPRERRDFLMQHLR